MCSLWEECREEMCDRPRIYLRLSPIPSVSKHQAYGDREDEKGWDISKENKVDKARHCVASTSQEKTSHVWLYYASEFSPLIWGWG